MAAPTTIPGDCVIGGTLYVASFVPSAGSIRNAGIASDAAIVATKLEHQFALTYGTSGTAASATIPIHCAYGATGDVISIKAGSVAIAVGAATVTVDLRKNGSTILTGVITLDTGNTAYVGEAGTILTAPYVAGDTFTLVVVATAGGGTLPTGLFVTVILREDAAP